MVGRHNLVFEVSVIRLTQAMIGLLDNIHADSLKRELKKGFEMTTKNIHMTATCKGTFFCKLGAKKRDGPPLSERKDEQQ